MAVRVTVTGGAKLRARLGKLAGVIREVGAEAVQDWADDVRDTAEDYAPRDTGYMALQIEDRVDKDRLKAEVGVWDDEAYYAQFVHDGTSSQEAQPFLQQAWEQHRNPRPYIKDALERHLG